MSSSQRDDRPTSPARHRRSPGGLRSWANPRSLRVRVLGVLVGLLALMFLAVGTVTTVMMHRFQVGQLDTQLSAAGDRFTNHPPPWQDTSGGGSYTGPGPVLGDPGVPVPGQRPGGQTDQGQLASCPTQRVGTAASAVDDGLFGARQGPGTLNAQLVHGEVCAAAYLDTGGDRHPVPEAQLAVLARLPVDRKPYTRDLGGLGSYRLTAIRTSRGDVLVTGLPMAEVNATRVTLIAVETCVGLLALLVATIGGAAVIKLALKPLTRVAETARRVSELHLHEGEVALHERVPAEDTDPRSEVGQVGAALNRMLGHVASALTARQASETRLRQFVADASHELRTPLAAIRGYTELTRRHRPATPPQVSDALDRVEAAAGRMTTLVEDLLLLARLDARRPLTIEPVDLSAMVIEAVTDAHVAGPEHRWRLDLPDESVITMGDGARLHQVVANLLANARTHTPEGTTVTTSLTVVPGAVELRVVDDGQGIPPELVPRLFERFARGDTSRSRRTGSTGLGLAIVHAVTAAHGGAVTVASAPGRTEFLIRLPATADSQPTPSGDEPAQQPQTAFLPA